MPIYNKPTIKELGYNNEVHNHVSKAAKNKRTLEQDYINFDTIDALTYDENDGLCKAACDQECNCQRLPMQKAQSSLQVNNSESFNTVNYCKNSHTNHRPSSPSKSSRGLAAAFYKHNSCNVSSNSTSGSKAAEYKQPLHNDLKYENENFVLPRASLKYQSVGTTTNSMPLVAISATHNGPDQHLQNINNKSKSVLVTSSSASTFQSARKTRFVKKNCSVGDKVGTNFLTSTSFVAVATTTPTATLASDKKPSIGSTTTITSSVGAVKQQLLPQIVSSARNIELTATKASTNTTKESVQRRRANSNYSTDKSGSSGYYSSNVCSTYSLEDHVYCEPVTDMNKSKSMDAESVSNSVDVHKKQQQPQPQTKILPSLTKSALSDCKLVKTKFRTVSQTRVVKGSGQFKLQDAANDEYEDSTQEVSISPHQKSEITKKLTENLLVLESSIEKLDRHLKNFPINTVNLSHDDFGDRTRAYNLPTIMEGCDPSSRQQDIVDDSLLDLDLDSFLLVNESKGKNLDKTTILLGGLDNRTFDTDEQEENNYKCAKYINSCPENAYHVESEISADSRPELHKCEVNDFFKRYEDQLHFQNTRDLLEDVREKIRLLSHPNNIQPSTSEDIMQIKPNDDMPKELHSMIAALKQQLESYLTQMNQRSEQEIRQLCTSLLKNQKIVRMKNAFERRRSTTSLNGFGSEYDFSAYEVIHDGGIVSATGIAPDACQEITSIRCASDPNFKMKRKSLSELFPATACYNESTVDNQTAPPNSQMQRNLTFQKPILHQSDYKIFLREKDNGALESIADKDSILDWHRKKPSIWEMYYGSKRLNQSLLGKRSGIVVSSNHASMSYPSSRPESDFTLDLPRAEQLRIKMEKEKKFRHRCRYITTFLSLVFFLLTVMVVSLVLTRGKRMFGSMI